MDRWALLYDAECPFCCRIAALLIRWDGGRRLRAVGLQSDEGIRLTADMDRHARMDSWHLAAPDGRRWSAGAAAPLLFGLLRFGAPLASLTRAFPRQTEQAYRYVSRHRGAIARALGWRGCPLAESFDPRPAGNR